MSRTTMARYYVRQADGSLRVIEQNVQWNSELRCWTGEDPTLFDQTNTRDPHEWEDRLKAARKPSRQECRELNFNCDGATLIGIEDDIFGTGTKRTKGESLCT